MMVNVIVYDKNSISRIAKRTLDFFSNEKSAHATKNFLLLNGIYFRFHTNSVTINAFNQKRYSKNEITDCLYYIFKNEEIHISNETTTKYIKQLTSPTCFDSFIY